MLVQFSTYLVSSIPRPLPSTNTLEKKFLQLFVDCGFVMGFRGQPDRGKRDDCGKHQIKMVVFLSDSLLQSSVPVVVLIQVFAVLLYKPGH